MRQTNPCEMIYLLKYFVVNASFFFFCTFFSLSLCPPLTQSFPSHVRWVSFYCEALSIDRVWCLFNIFIALSFLLLLLTFLPLSICRRSIAVHLIWKSIPTDHRFYTNHKRTFLPTLPLQKMPKKREKRNFKQHGKKSHC